jgi:hypothetical protein
MGGDVMPGERQDPVRAWCDRVAALGVDALVDAGLVAKGEFKNAAAIAAEELFVRLGLDDYPPRSPVRVPRQEVRQ